MSSASFSTFPRQQARAGWSSPTTTCYRNGASSSANSVAASPIKRPAACCPTESRIAGSQRVVVMLLAVTVAAPGLEPAPSAVVEALRGTAVVRHTTVVLATVMEVALDPALGLVVAVALVD